MENKQSHFQWSVHLLVVLLVTVLSGCAELISSGQAELVKAIPNNAAFIIKISSPEDFVERLADRPYRDVVTEQIMPGELMDNHAAVTALLNSGGFLGAERQVPMLASLHLASSDQLNSIHYYPLQLSQKAYQKQLKEQFPGAASQEWNYEGVLFNEVLLPEMKTKVTAAFSHGILIVSPVSFLVEDAVKQLKSGNTLLSESGFNKVHNKETNEADANIWLPLANSRHWISLFASKRGMELTQHLGDMASWMLMDLYLNEDEIFMSGITSLDPGDRLHGLNGSSACSHILDDHIPFNTASYHHYAQIPDSVASTLSAYGIDDCWTRILIEPLNENIEDHFIYLLPIADRSVFNASAKEGIHGAINTWLMQGSEGYFKVTGEFLATSPNDQLLDSYIKNISGGNVLSKDENFQALSEDLKADAQLTFYARTLYHRETFNVVFSSASEAAKDYKSFKGFNQMAWQFSRQGDVFLTTATLTYNETDAGGHSNLAWGVELGAPVLAGPKVVELDANGTAGILVQDTDFNLYLLDKSGDIIWKRTLESRWMGSVYSLALFEGSGHSLTFNTETNWHLINGQGEDIAGFPLHFKDRASASMSLFELKNQEKDIYVFIPSKNGNLYGYELSGKPIPGWNPKEKTGVLLYPPQFHKDGSDLFVSATNEDGMTYIWNFNGRGKARNAFKTEFPSDNFLDTASDPFKIKNVKEDGELVSINPRGRIGRYQLPADHVKQFQMANVHGGKDPEIILSNGASIWLFDYKGSRIWKKNYTGEFRVLDIPGSSRSVLGVSNEAKRTFTILSSDGNPMNDDVIEIGRHMDFTALDLLGSGQPALITNGSGNEVYCYRVVLKD